MKLRLFLISCVSAVAVACGSDSDDGGPGTGGAGGIGAGGGAGSGGTGTGGTSGGSGGTATCEALESDYSVHLAEAKRCSRLPNGTTPCTAEIGSDLVCGCPVRVDAAHAPVLMQLAAIRDEWRGLGCGEPCAADCAAPSGATCEAGNQGGDVGVCVTTY